MKLSCFDGIAGAPCQRFLKAQTDELALLLLFFLLDGSASSRRHVVVYVAGAEVFEVAQLLSFVRQRVP